MTSPFNASASSIILPSRRRLLRSVGALGLSAVAAVAITRGIFEKNGLDVELINYTGSTDQLLESIATSKADAGLGMIHRWSGPVDTGFAGCVGSPKGLAPGANRSWVGNPARIGNAAIGLLGPNPKGSVPPERHSALRALPRRPVWAATRALIGAQGTGFAPVKPVSTGPCRWSRAST
jgi:hypothetical protein